MSIHPAGQLESSVHGPESALDAKPDPPNHRTALIWLIRLAVLTAVIGSWQLVAARAWINPSFTGKPSVIVGAFWQVITSNVMTQDLPTTLEETILGFLLGAIVGFAGGVVLSQVAILRKALGPLLTAVNSMPRVALAPLLIIWFGLGLTSKIAMSFSLVVFIVLTNTTAGLMSSDRDLLLLGNSFGARGWRYIRYFVLPGSVPVLAAGLELGLIYSFLGVIVGELVGGYSGLGVVLAAAANSFDTNRFFAVLFLLSIVSTLFTVFLRMGERRLLRWHYVEMAATDRM